MLSDETLYPETASTNMTYGSFHQGRESIDIELDFFVLQCSLYISDFFLETSVFLYAS